MKQNIVFLDFDGVIVTSSTKYTEADPRCVICLNEILESANAAVVISSSWRIGRSTEQLDKILSEWGVQYTKILGVTPILRTQHGSVCLAATRGEEIACWLKVNKQHWFNFVILDDDGDMGPVAHKLVRTEFDIGLQPKHVKRALALLEA